MTTVWGWFEHTFHILTGVCLGMQCAVIEFARSVLGHKDANSTEFNPETGHPVVSNITSFVTASLA